MRYPTLAALFADNARRRDMPKPNYWTEEHAAHISHDCRQVISEALDLLPHGSGIDAEWTPEMIQFDQTSDSLLIEIHFHRMDDGGYYDGWDVYILKLRPGWQGIDFLDVEENKGKDEDVEDHLCECFLHVLSMPVQYHLDGDGIGKVVRFSTMDEETEHLKGVLPCSPDND